MAYCSENDLLVGDMEFSAATSKESFVRDAANEMDARLGFVYVLPITGIPAHAQTLLKMINARLASGRLLMSIAAPAEDDGVHRYGEWLIKEAYNDLHAICNGSIQLAGATSTADPTPRSGASYNHDEESAFDMFENQVMRGVPSWWQPGSVS
jgi:hypothetical protein